MCPIEVGGGGGDLQREPTNPFPQHSSQWLERPFGVTLEDSVELAPRGPTAEGSFFISEDHSCRLRQQLKAWCTQRWGRKKTPGHPTSLMGPGNQWCVRVTARSPSHSTPWASPSWTEELALWVCNGWEAMEGRGVHGGLGVSQAGLSPGSLDLSSSSFQLPFSAMKIITYLLTLRKDSVKNLPVYSKHSINGSCYCASL